MADDSKTKPAKKANRFKLDFRGWVGVIALLSLVGLIMYMVWPREGIGWWGSSSGSSDARTVRQVVTSVAPTRLFHWNDANGDGRMQSIERQPVQLSEGCYTFRASQTETRLSHDGPNGPYHELGSILLINGKLHNEVLRVEEGQNLQVSFYPFPGASEYPRVINQGGYQLIHITLRPTSCPEPRTA